MMKQNNLILNHPSERVRFLGDVHFWRLHSPLVHLLWSFFMLSEGTSGDIYWSGVNYCAVSGLGLWSLKVHSRETTFHLRWPHSFASGDLLGARTVDVIIWLARWRRWVIWLACLGRRQQFFNARNGCFGGQVLTDWWSQADSLILVKMFWLLSGRKLDRRQIRACFLLLMHVVCQLFFFLSLSLVTIPFLFSVSESRGIVKEKIPLFSQEL